MRQRIEELATEAHALEALLAAKKQELREVEEMAKKEKEARRIGSEEVVLKSLFLRVFDKNASVEVDPEEGVTVHILINHSAARTINDILSPMTDGTVLIQNKIRVLGGNQCIDISFPFSKLERVKEGLKLSTGADLSAAEPMMRGRC